MKLRVKHVINEVTIAEVIKQIFQDTYIENLPRFFYDNANGVAINIIDGAIKYVLGYDDDIDLEALYEKSDIDVVKNKVYDIMYSIVKADKECE